MEKIIEKVRQANRILTGEEGPQLTLDRSEDARYIYPAKISAALKVLRETELLLTSHSSKADKDCIFCFYGYPEYNKDCHIHRHFLDTKAGGEEG